VTVKPQSVEDFREWMDRYDRASETSDPAAAAALFAEDAVYQETPFDEPMRGREAIYRYWSGASQWIQESRFNYQILSMEENRGIALWQSRITRRESGNLLFLDGVFLVEFDEAGLCSRFREWWHRREEPAASTGSEEAN
jgi:ketosteroid isomerase-like protein